MLKQTTSFPLAATLRALLDQQQPRGGDAEGNSVFDGWLADAVQWDGHRKRDKEAAGLLLHLLKTGTTLDRDADDAV